MILVRFRLDLHALKVCRNSYRFVLTKVVAEYASDLNDLEIIFGDFEFSVSSRCFSRWLERFIARNGLCGCDMACRINGKLDINDAIRASLWRVLRSRGVGYL